MRWARVCIAAGAMSVAGVLLLPPAVGAVAAEDESSIASSDEKIEAGQTLNFTVNCQKGDVDATAWYSRKGATDKRGETTASTDANGKADMKMKLPDDVKKGDYSVSVQCGDTNIVKNDFTVIVAEESKSPSASASPDKSMTVSPTTVAPGGTITITGYCDKATKDAKVWYGDADGSGQPYTEKSGIEADADGKVSQSLVVTKDTKPGSYDAVLLCSEEDGKTQTAGFTVSSGGTTAGDGSTASGGDGITLALVGGGMLAAAALGGAIYMQRRGLGVAG